MLIQVLWGHSRAGSVPIKLPIAQMTPIQSAESVKSVDWRWRKVLLGLLLLAGLGSSMRFAVDYSCFRSASPESTLVEIYHTIPYEELHYRSYGDTIYAEYLVVIKLRNLASGQTVSESLYEPAAIPLSAEPARRRLSVGHSFSLNLVPGQYELQFAVRESLGSGELTETLDVRDLSVKPSISDPIVGSSLVRGPNGMTSVVPLASRSFGGDGPREMYVYVDGYDFPEPDTLRHETLDYELSVTIEDSAGNAVKALPLETRRRTRSQPSELFMMTTQGLRPGTYRLHVKLASSLRGHSRGDDVPIRTAEAAKRFKVEVGATAGPWGHSRGGNVPGQSPAGTGPDTMDLSAEDREDYHDIRYAATEREYAEFKKLSAVGQNEYLWRFWQKHDLETYLRRLRVADARYGWGRKRGRETDRGRVYVRYGEPDEVDVHTMIEHAKPHEHWRYFNLGFHFIFIDIHGDSRYSLVYSNTDVEPRNPSWEQLVDPLELDDLER
jgi:GWxTD domain-containing protein